MKDGNYKKFFDWRGLESNVNLRGNLSPVSCNFDTCGTAAISTLTGLSPYYVEKQLPKSQKHWSDRSLTSFLKQRGFDIYHLTKNLVTSINSNFYYFSIPYNITKYHCLLLNSLVCEGEASYFVVYHNEVYHNFKVTELSPLFWINRPTQTAFIVKHKKWR